VGVHGEARVVDRYYDPILAVGRLLTGKKLRTVAKPER
jgi:hypothetical protein